MSLQGKRIVLGITGGIAAYKCPQLIRDFIKQGAEVRVVATQNALRFVSELSLSVVSQYPVLSDTFQTNVGGTWHISYAEWADLIVVAPATVNTIAKIVNGYADNALTTLLCARRTPVLICPAADTDMYSNPINTRNLHSLEKMGFNILPGESGELASGLHGIGRLPGLDKITHAAETALCGYTRDLSGTRVLITAGPTYEDIDPVRFLGNRSSGKMGFALARAAFLRGAEVTLVCGPVALKAYPEIRVLKTRSALDMYNTLQQEADKHDILVMAAAVADYRPAEVAINKIKKHKSSFQLNLIENPDLLKGLSEAKMFKVGFALETENEEENAMAKLRNKGLDIIVLNSLRSAEAGFEVDTNEVAIFSRNGSVQKIPLMSKFLIAHRILDAVKEHRPNAEK
ncbi:MAG: bifunctional phosphopantothenoylcysteine decarboxylase/phosphopantothenate--cysteine ligase CoaBC [Ignavibacteria bacterium]|nr:bifunctional phosphopantothenoylcysteine decarboxylase/phosphopantothenate--cysteine ligase CoaBC [Ignavibacteria bacterium]